MEQHGPIQIERVANGYIVRADVSFSRPIASNDATYVFETLLALLAFLEKRFSGHSG